MKSREDWKIDILNFLIRRITDGYKASNNISTGSKLSVAKDNPGKTGKNENQKIQVLT